MTIQENKKQYERALASALVEEFKKTPQILSALVQKHYQREYKLSYKEMELEFHFEYNKKILTTRELLKEVINVEGSKECAFDVADYVVIEGIFEEIPFSLMYDITTEKETIAQELTKTLCCWLVNDME